MPHRYCTIEQPEVLTGDFWWRSEAHNALAAHETGEAPAWWGTAWTRGIPPLKLDKVIQ